MSHLEKSPSSGASTSVTNTDQHTLRKTPYRLSTTSFTDILNGKYGGSGTQDDPFLVEWLPSDNENPQNWATVYKWLTTIQVAIATLSVSLASSAYSGAVESIQHQFQPSKQIIVTLGVSLFVLGFAFGPLLWAPFSEVVGRRALYIGTYAAFTLWQAVSIASPNIESLLVFRFLAGFFGSSPLVNTGGVLTDMFNPNEIGVAMAVFASAPFLGPVLGPITGGFIGESSAENGWKWVMAFLALFSGAITIAGAVLVPETYAPVLLRWRARKLSEITGQHYICKLDKGRDISLKALFSVALGRPWKLLIWEPIVTLLSVYVALIYGTLYSLFTAFPITFQQNRGWSPGIGGLAFLGVMVGMLLAVSYIIFYENPRYIKIAKKHGGIAPPEARLAPAMVGAVSIVVGLGIFAATDDPSLPWIASIIAGAPFGFGLVLVFLSVMMYLSSSYLLFTASVLAANSVIRSLFGFAFPLFTPEMYSIGGKNGIHWGPAIGGFLALACLPFPFLFAKYGAKIRERCKYASEAKRLLEQLQASSKRQQDTPADKTETTETDIEAAQQDTIDEHDEATQVHTPTNEDPELKAKSVNSREDA
ncbi:putative mfs-multidrug-resistance transporter [Testicularia cyperi]|uniref:Putative mfs-multidrug-resistance transporter n=1 Tax=Testicularia cyperi TaxID=1882483 RepID=A0A317XXI1_9BASI|nr:putative mfs-multidrug-resistance transporter [Testicularia cyperi]